MKTKSIICIILTTVGAALVALSPASAQTPLLRLQAANYNATTGTWTATTGSNAIQGTAGNRATLVATQTSNGSSVVRFDGTDDFMTLASTIATGTTSDYTVFAYLRPNATSDPKTIFGGTDGTFQYRISATEQQQALRQEVAVLGTGTTILATGGPFFSNINLTVSDTATGTIRLNGADNGTTAVSGGFAGVINRIGARNPTAGGIEYFSGDIAEIRIYDSVLTLTQRQTIEQELFTTYGPVPEPHEYAVAMSALLLALIVVRRKRMARATA